MNQPRLLHDATFPVADSVDQVPRSLLWLAITALFLIVHFPHDAVLQLLDLALGAVRNSEMLDGFLGSVSGKYSRSNHAQLVEIAMKGFIIPTKTLGFVLSVVLLFVPIVSSLKNASWIWRDGKFKTRCRDTAGIFAGLALLVVPRFLQSLGDEYGRMSLSPFTEGYGLYYRRLLMPALAHLAGANGYLLYFFFSLLCTCILIFVVRLWFESKDIHHSRFFSLSLMTGSFVIYNVQMPGYPEQLAFVLILASGTVPMTWQGRIATIACVLATHEALVVVLLPIIWFLFPREERGRALLVVALYAIVMLAGHAATDFGFVSSLSYTDERGWTPLRYFSEYPLLSFAGSLFAHKLFWLVLFAATYFSIRNNDNRGAMALLAFALLPLLTLPLAVDASRLAGWGFMGVLIALLSLQKENIISELQLRILAWLNLGIPSCYVGLNSGVHLLPGFYRIWHLFAGFYTTSSMVMN